MKILFRWEKFSWFCWQSDCSKYIYDSLKKFEHYFFISTVAPLSWGHCHQRSLLLSGWISDALITKSTPSREAIVLIKPLLIDPLKRGNLSHKAISLQKGWPHNKPLNLLLQCRSWSLCQCFDPFAEIPFNFTMQWEPTYTLLFTSKTEVKLRSYPFHLTLGS